MHCSNAGWRGKNSSLVNGCRWTYPIPPPVLCPAGLSPDVPHVGAFPCLVKRLPPAGFAVVVDDGLLLCFDPPWRGLNKRLVREVTVGKSASTSRVAKRAVLKKAPSRKRKTMSRKIDLKSSGWYAKAAMSISAARTSLTS